MQYIKSNKIKLSLNQLINYFTINSTHVLSEDTISREVKNGKLYSKRLLTKVNRVPKWAERFIGKNTNVKILEESIVDPKEKVFITYTRNLTYTRVMVRACTH